MKYIRVGLSVFCLFLLSGCAGYQLGSTKDPGFKRIFIENFRSEVEEPELEHLVTTTIIQQFQRDGTVQVTDREHADAILQGTIDKFELSPLRYSRQNELSTTQASMSIGVRYFVTKKGQSKPFITSRAQGSTSFFVGSDLQSDKRQGVPLAAQELGKQIVANIVEGW